MTIDPYILTFSALTVLVTIWMGFWSAKKSKTASDFFVAGRSVSVGWNASAISGEYLSAASFMGVAGMVMSSGYDALWYPVCYACGYLFLLLFIAGPLRRFGAYTIPDFAEGRFDSPLFRKIAVIFVLFIGFFYTMPQMKGAGTTLSYIFQDFDLRGTALSFLAPHNDQGQALAGLNYFVGVFLVGAVITFNVALGGMKGITLVQAFQYWAKMFAISVPVFVLMAVYGHYGNHLGANRTSDLPIPIDLQFDFASSNIAVTGSFTYQGQTNPVNLRGTQDKLPEFVTNSIEELRRTFGEKAVVALNRGKLPAKAPPDSTWLNPFGPLTTKAAKAAAAALGQSATNVNSPGASGNPRSGLAGSQSGFSSPPSRFSDSRNGFSSPQSGSGSPQNRVGSPQNDFGNPQNALGSPPKPSGEGQNGTAGSPSPQKAWLDKHERPLALLYTYSLIIALVCGTAGLPHILVRFYTNPDGVAAKRTTMWVMILIGVFYLFPPVFGVMGRNLMPELYNGLAGVKGTDGIVLKLPKLLNERFGVLGSILSGITCAGAFAAFMSTFSGLLVSMTSALAHDVYGRILRPQSTPAQRLKMFKLCTVIVGGGAILLGFLVEGFEINKMVGWAFAIAATSYFPLLFLSTWWRGITMKGAATGMLGGGTLSLLAIASTMFADQAAWAAGLKSYYTVHPLLRILAEQPAIWGLPLALGLMYVVSKLTAKDIPADIRLKMLVLHAPEKLGLKQDYIQEHQPGH